MMAGLDSQDREQPRVDKVTIVHAGEDIENIIRPLADTLEKNLKLGEQAEYVRAYRPGTDIAEYIMNCICMQQKLDDTLRLVIVVSKLFISKCSTNQAAFEQIKSKLFSQNHSQSEFALVCPNDIPPQWSNLRCINLGVYVKDIESSNVAEAIYKQWFGPKATLSSQSELSSMRDVALNSGSVVEKYAPDKVKIIHAMNHPDARLKYWGKLATAIEDVANPENTTQSRLHFRGDSSVAKTLLTDLEGFKKCATAKKINAVIMWCPDMLRALNQDTATKTRFIEILCEDRKLQKLFAHFMFGVDSQEMGHFSQQMWDFLSLHKHVAYIEASQVDSPNLDYKRHAKIFLRFWTGSRVEPNIPEESSDPSMNSLETSIEHVDISRNSDDLSIASSSQYQSSLNQFQPQQDQNRDHLVMNGESIDHGDANLIREKGKALGNTDSFTQDRLVTTSDSWDPTLAAAANISRNSQSDGCSNPPGNWSLRGPSLQDERGIRQVQLGVVCQPMVGSDGHNKMATASHSSVSVDSVRGSKPQGARCRHIPSGPAGILSETQGHQPPASRRTNSLPAGGPQGLMAGNQQMAQAQQPVRPKSGVIAGQNRIAASGFISHSICSTDANASTVLMSSVSGDTSDDGRIVSGSVEQSVGPGSNQLQSVGPGSNQLSVNCPYSTVQQNPVRLSSDAAHEVDAAIRRIFDNSGEPPSFPFMGTGREQDVDTSVPGMHSSRSMPSMPFASCPSSTGLLSAAEGVNPMQNGESNASSQLEIDNQPPGSMLLCKLEEPTIRSLKIYLDPMKNVISDWRDLASYFKVPSELINYWKGMQGNQSPTEQLIEWLKAKQGTVTIDDFKAGLKKVVRFDVLKYLSDAGF